MDTGKLEGITARTNSIAIRLTHNDKVYHKSLKLKPTPNNLKYAYAQRIAWREQLAKGDMPDGFKFVSVSGSFMRSLDLFVEFGVRFRRVSIH